MGWLPPATYDDIELLLLIIRGNYCPLLLKNAREPYGSIIMHPLTQSLDAGRFTITPVGLGPKHSHPYLDI